MNNMFEIEKYYLSRVEIVSPRGIIDKGTVFPGLMWQKLLLYDVPEHSFPRMFEEIEFPIQTVIGDLIPLRELEGKMKIADCPFCNQPDSVMVNMVVFKCMECGKAGNSTNFIMMHQNLTYPKAVSYLVAKYGKHSPQ
jgi:hypothetical protein